jgi:hypothetical protein
MSRTCKQHHGAAGLHALLMSFSLFVSSVWGPQGGQMCIDVCVCVCVCV